MQSNPPKPPGRPDDVRSQHAGAPHDREPAGPSPGRRRRRDRLRRRLSPEPEPRHRTRGRRAEIAAPAVPPPRHMPPGKGPGCPRNTFGISKIGDARYTIPYVTEIHLSKRKFRTRVTHRRATPNPTSQNATDQRHKNHQYVLPNARRNPFPNPLTHSKIKTIQREKTIQPPPNQTPSPKFIHSHHLPGHDPKQRLIRTLIEEVIIDLDDEANEAVVTIH